jgi:hypothetical protein
MEEQDWKNIISELTEQIKQLSIERAVARADVAKLLNVNQMQTEELKNLKESPAGKEAKK